MCGLTGFLIHPNSMPERPVDSIVRESAKSLTHRGPDAIGIWCGENNSIAMGHRRLSIIDLSETGGQPIHSTCGRYVMVFNGEIYNFLELRKQLSAEGVEFDGHSDTKVLIESVSKWGIEKTIKKTIGMFAIAVWDKKIKRYIYVGIGLVRSHCTMAGIKVFLCLHLSSKLSKLGLTSSQS